MNASNHTPELPGRADIAVVMITVDRSPKRNYLRETIDNLERGGVFTSERLRSFTLVLGQPITEVSESYRYIDTRSAFPMISAHQRLLPCENAGGALILGSKLASSHPNGWVLFLEDDIDCCADFLGSVGRWLDRYGDNPSWRSALYQFGCSYPQICQTHKEECGNTLRLVISMERKLLPCVQSTPKPSARFCLPVPESLTTKKADC